MGSLIESIRQQGIISPLIVRAIESTDEYEVISGHRRLHAAVKAGLSEVLAPMIKCKKTPKKKCRFMAERKKKR